MVKNRRGRRQADPEAVRDAAKEKAAQEDDKKTVITVKSKAGKQRAEILELTRKATVFEDEIAAMCIEQGAALLELENVKNEANLKKLKLQEELSTMDKKNVKYKQLRIDFFDAQAAETKLTTEWKALKSSQANTRRRKESELALLKKQIAHEEVNLEESVEDSKSRREKPQSIVSEKSVDKRKAIADWAEKCKDFLDPVLEVEDVPVKDATNNTTNSNPIMGVQAQTTAISSTPIIQCQMMPDPTLKKILARQSVGKDLPHFSGEPERWPRFKKEFQRLSDECGYSDSENMARLEKSLKGQALNAVESLLASPENVQEVMNRLEQLFGQSSLVINAMIEKVKKIPAIRDGRMSGMIDLGIAVSNLTATLKTLGCQKHLDNPYIVKELEDKLPSDYRVKWFEWVKNDKERTDDLISFSRWITDQTDIIRKAFPMAMVSEKKYEKSKDSKDFKKEKCHSTAAEGTARKKSTCNACGKEGHWANQCRTLQAKTIEERRRLVSEKKLCFCCLVPGHRSNDCRRKKACGENGCQDTHHPLLHKPATTEGVNASAAQQNDPNIVVQEFQNAVNHSSGGALMGAIPVTIKGPLGSVKCLAFLDNGSSVTMLEDSLAEEIGVEGEKQSFCMSTMTNTKQFRNSKKVSVSVSGNWKGAPFYSIDGVRTVDEVSLGRMTQDAESIKQKWPYLSKVPIPSFTEEKPRLLIGNLHCFLTTTRQSVGSSQNQPMAFKCRLGWSVGGPKSSQGVEEMERCYHTCDSVSMDDLLHQMVKSSFTTEDFGVKINNEKPRSREDKRAMEILKDTTIRIDNGNRFETGLLWKDRETKLPESYNTALRRLICQEKKMDRDPAFAEVYNKKMQEYEEKGFIRKLSREEIETDSTRLWYLPHFGVWNPNKPGKMRLVFDAAAKSHGVSLNSSLCMGPDFNNPLVSVLWKFRKHKVAVVGDIKDMYHRVNMRREDRVSQRFLWRGNRRDGPPDEYEMTVCVFGATCSPSSAQYVKAKNAEDFEFELPEASIASRKNFYVDDFLYSCPCVEEAKKMVRDIILINEKAGYDVCNWMSNSKEVIESIPEEKRSQCLKEINLDSDDLPTGRVLGLWWDPTTDDFNFKLKMHKVPEDVLKNVRRPTKRELLQVAMSLYDPCGFVGHLAVKVKILQQDVWRKEIGWDDELPTGLHEKWKDWLEQLHGITAVRIPRCYSDVLYKAEDITLHVFCDASEKAFAAIAFLRVQEEDDVKITIVASKTRVAPLKPLSIPRLELQAAVLATRLANSFREESEIAIKKTTFWSDSMTVLRWIRSDARCFKPFISHRLGEIMETTEVADWRYVPTILNVADDATRDDEPADLSRESRWFNGPSFLKEDPSNWPKDKDGKGEVREEDLEMKKCQVNVIGECEDWMHKPSSFRRLVRITAYVKRFILLRCKKVDSPMSSFLSIRELRNAENCVIRRVQKESFGEELECLYGGKPIPRRSRIWKLEPFMSEDGILRVGGRLGRCQEKYEFRYPALLDRKSSVTKAMLQMYHELSGHQGVRTVANEVRQKYWILDGIAAVNEVFRNCEACKKRKIKPSSPKMSDLPEYRVQSKILPFTNAGMDYFGPMSVQVRRGHENRWGVIFTCLSTRAIHLEIASSLTTDSCIMAIQRFKSRRGYPTNIYSDNGTNFHGTNNELKKLLKEIKPDVIGEKVSSFGVQWNFNPPGAPHMGGVWERLVGSVKRTMNGILKDVHPREEVLHTVMCEAESILNSRPLTDVSVDPRDPVSLTPNHFLLGWSAGSPPPEMRQPVWERLEDYDLFLRKQWRFCQHLANQFWIRWRKEFLPTLTRRSKWMESKSEVSEGDVVIVVADTAPRNNWPLGRIIAVYPGKDGVVRVVDVKTSSGVYRRPVSKICRLQHVSLDEVPSSGESNVKL